PPPPPKPPPPPPRPPPPRPPPPEPPPHPPPHRIGVIQPHRRRRRRRPKPPSRNGMTKNNGKSQLKLKLGAWGSACGGGDPRLVSPSARLICCVPTSIASPMSPARRRGVMSSRMMRPDCRSVSWP